MSTLSGGFLCHLVHNNSTINHYHTSPVKRELKERKYFIKKSAGAKYAMKIAQLSRRKSSDDGLAIT